MSDTQLIVIVLGIVGGLALAVLAYFGKKTADIARHCLSCWLIALTLSWLTMATNSSRCTKYLTRRNPLLMIRTIRSTNY